MEQPLPTGPAVVSLGQDLNALPVSKDVTVSGMLQIGTSGKCFAANGCHTVGDCNFCQTGTIPECALADGNNTVRDAYTGQSAATLK